MSNYKISTLSVVDNFEDQNTMVRFHTNNPLFVEQITKLEGQLFIDTLNGYICSVLKTNTKQLDAECYNDTKYILAKRMITDGDLVDSVNELLQSLIRYWDKHFPNKIYSGELPIVFSNNVDGGRVVRCNEFNLNKLNDNLVMKMRIHECTNRPLISTILSDVSELDVNDVVHYTTDSGVSFLVTFK